MWIEKNRAGPKKIDEPQPKKHGSDTKKWSPEDYEVSLLTLSE